MSLSVLDTPKNTTNSKNSSSISYNRREDPEEERIKKRLAFIKKLIPIILPFLVGFISLFGFLFLLLIMAPAGGDEFMNQLINFDFPYKTLEYLYEQCEDEKELIDKFEDIFTYTLITSEDYTSHGTNKKIIKDTIKRLKNGESLYTAKDKELGVNESCDAISPFIDSVIGDITGTIKKQKKGKKTVSRTSKDGTVTKKKVSYEWKTYYTLKRFYPYASGYKYKHHDDFGNDRTYGATNGTRPHLGNDLMAKTGVPIVAVESGTITAKGWNNLGGWRLGVTSNDGKRYYYYAHMDRYQTGLNKGDSVKAGDVIGYTGNSGYGSVGTTGQFAPHLHIQIQVSYELDGNVEKVWINPYNYLKLLENNKATLKELDEEKKTFTNKYNYKF